MIDALRARLAQYGRPTTNDLLAAYLEAANWNVTVAFDLWRTEQAMNGQPVQAAPGIVAPTQEVQQRRQDVVALPHSDNIENNRREAARQFLATVNAGRIPAAGIQLSTSAVLFLLRDSNWDLEVAARRFNREAALGRLHIRYDGTRSTEQAAFAKPTPQGAGDGAVQQRQDERLALAVEITGRPDVESVAAHLARHGWNLPRALDEWFRNGFTVVKDKHGNTTTRLLPNKSRTPVPSDQDILPPDNQDLSVFCPEPAQYMQAKEYKGPKKPASQQDTGADRDVGFLLNDDGKPVKLGCENPYRYLKSYIQHGKLRENRYEGKSFYFWPGIKGNSGNSIGQSGNPLPPPPPPPSSSSSSSESSSSHAPSSDGEEEKSCSSVSPDTPKKPLVEFEWTRQVDIDRLNAFHRENNYRIKGTKKRDRAWPWTEAERKKLIQLHEEEWPAVVQQYPDPKDPKRKIEFSRELGERWEGIFNGPEFKGKEVNGLTRNTDRNRAAINTQRGRMQELIDRFGVTRDEKWFATKEEKAAAKKKKEEQEAKKKAKKEAENKAKEAKAAAQRKEDAGRKRRRSTPPSDDLDDLPLPELKRKDGKPTRRRTRRTSPVPEDSDDFTMPELKRKDKKPDGGNGGAGDGAAGPSMVK